LPAGADLAAAFSIPVSVKPVASVRWAIRDGPHKNMQAGKRGIIYWPRRAQIEKSLSGNQVNRKWISGEQGYNVQQIEGCLMLPPSLKLRRTSDSGYWKSVSHVGDGLSHCLKIKIPPEGAGGHL